MCGKIKRNVRNAYQCTPLIRLGGPRTVSFMLGKFWIISRRMPSLELELVADWSVAVAAETEITEVSGSFS